MTVAHAPHRVPPVLKMDLQARELEDLFEENSASSHTVTSSLNREHEVYAQHGFLQAPPTVSQVTNRQRCARLLRARTVAYALPGGAYGVSLQIIDLTQGWSNAVTEQIALADLLAMVAAVCICTNCTLLENKGTLMHYLNFSKPLLRCKGLGLTTSRHSTKHRSSIKTLFLLTTTLATNWQSLRPKSG